MLTTHTLKPGGGARKRGKRVGRGLGSGKGVYAGKGRKGQKARAGGRMRPGFEGGQTPLSKRLPFLRGVRGAGSVMTGGPPRRRPQTINLEHLNRFPAGSEVTPETLREAGLLDGDRVKVLGGGRIAHALTIRAHGFSQSARKAIEEAGGKAEFIGGPKPERRPLMRREAPKARPPAPSKAEQVASTGAKPAKPAKAQSDKPRKAESTRPQPDAPAKTPDISVKAPDTPARAPDIPTKAPDAPAKAQPDRPQKRDEDKKLR